MTQKYWMYLVIALVMIVSMPTALAAVTPHGTARADGDSFLLAVSGLNPQYDNTFVNRFGGYYGLDMTNAGVGGSNTTAVLSRIYTEVPVPTPFDTHVINVGYNDVRNRWMEKEVPNATANRIAAMVAYLRADTVLKATDPSVEYTGSWKRSVPVHDRYSILVNTSYAMGDTARVSISGDTISIGILHYSPWPAMFNVTVDGDTKYAHGMAGYDSVQCPFNDSYCAFAVEIPVQSDGMHEVVIENVNGGKFAVDWIGSGHSETTPVIVVNGITKRPNLSNAYNVAVDTANAAIQSNLAMFDERVVYCNQDSWDAERYTLIGPGSDKTHPNNFGHALLFQNMREAI